MKLNLLPRPTLSCLGPNLKRHRVYSCTTTIWTAVTNSGKAHRLTGCVAGLGASLSEGVSRIMEIALANRTAR